MILRNWRTTAGFCWLSLFVAAASPRPSTTTPAFRFDRDTFAFANQTVFEYREGRPYARKKSNQWGDVYNRRCFVLCRTATQFYKFARFDPRSAPLDDKALAARIRSVTRQQAWAAPLPEDQRVVFPGYANLREMSKARLHVVQKNIGLGWPTYIRMGNFRMFYRHDLNYQEKTHANLDAALARGDLFVGYLSTYPSLAINHSILVYAQKTASSENEHYLVYDPNHGEAPRQLTWSPREHAFSYKKDSDFIGGFVRIYQVYGKWLQ